jgi:pectate lyase
MRTLVALAAVCVVVAVAGGCGGGGSQPGATQEGTPGTGLLDDASSAGVDASTSAPPTGGDDATVEGSEASVAGDDASAATDDAGDQTIERTDAGGDAGKPRETSDAAVDAGPHGGCGGGSPDALVGWASVSGMSVSTTTGGAGGPTVKVSTLSDLNTNAGGTTARVIEIDGTISGNVTVGSNKTIVGACGAEVHGHIQMTGSVNVIVRNLTVVGYNCTDNTSDCSAGADAVTVERNAHHLWFDHDDISDGSDGNLDITHASDFITISWTKFHYSGRRTDPAGAAGGHQFCNLIGHSDSNATEDTGHLRVTFHHTWWADNVVERMPRVRFGQVHLFDNLYTAAGDDYCIGVGVSANIRDENNVFVGVKNPIDSTSYSNSASIITSSGNVYQSTTGTTADIGAAAFTPPYAYSLDPAANVQAAVMSGAGPQ